MLLNRVARWSHFRGEMTDVFSIKYSYLVHIIWHLATMSLKFFLASLVDIGNLGPSSVFSANSKNTSPFQRVLSWAMPMNLVDIFAMTLIKKPWSYSSRWLLLWHLWHGGMIGVKPFYHKKKFQNYELISLLEIFHICTKSQNCLRYEGNDSSCSSSDTADEFFTIFNRISSGRDSMLDNSMDKNFSRFEFVNTDVNTALGVVT